MILIIITALGAVELAQIVIGLGGKELDPSPG